MGMFDAQIVVQNGVIYWASGDGAIRSVPIVEFLKALRKHLKTRLLIVWDGLRAHRSRLVRDYVDSTEGDSPSCPPTPRN